MLFLSTKRKTAGGVKRLQKVGEETVFSRKRLFDQVLQGKVQFSEKFAYFLPLSECKQEFYINPHHSDCGSWKCLPPTTNF